MDNKRLYRLLLWVTVVGTALTLLHLGWVFYAYPRTSIIRFIAGELWIKWVS